MKKTTLKPKLVLRKETMKLLVDGRLVRAGAGRGGPDISELQQTTCVAPLMPERK